MTGPRWVLEDVLARSSRPGYPSRDVAVGLVDAWIQRVTDLGIRGIVCLLSPEQLDHYHRLPTGLLEYYRKNGFTVESVPITDPVDNEAGWQQLEESLEAIYQAFKRLPKPVLIHCSAGVDRTGRAVTHLLERLQGQSAQRSR